MAKPLLALLGGSPVRRKPFSSRPHIDVNEQRAVAACLRDRTFSRFIGSPTPNVRKELAMTSADVFRLKEFWSFMGGPNVRKFEALWAKAHNVAYAISVNSATSGLTAALLAAGIEPGDEVITSPFSFTATATAIVAAQAVPVFADIDPETFCLDPKAVERLIGPRTRALMPVHILGSPGDLEGLLRLAKKHRLRVIEDSAQAPGARYQGRALGTFGDAGVFSFQETKNVMTGEGGMIVTNDPAVAAKARLIRNHGESIPIETDAPEFYTNAVGFNFRLIEPAAALGWAQTQKLRMLNQIRRANYLHLRRVLRTVACAFLAPQRLTNPDTYSPYCAGFRWDAEASGVSRDQVALALRAEGIPVSSGFPRLMSENVLFTKKTAFGSKGWPLTSKTGSHRYGREGLPNAVRLQYDQYLGFFQVGYPNTPKDMDDIAAAFAKIVAQRGALAAAQSSRPKTYSSGRL